MTSPSSRSYRLRGVVDGGERTFELLDSEQRVGSSPQSDVRLDVTGVSSEHAILRVTPGGLVVEDRGSTNGTYVNNVRVERAEVPAGAELRFGVARFAVEVLEAADAELAIEIAVSRPETPPAPVRGKETTRIECDDAGRVPGAWLGLIERFLNRTPEASLVSQSLALLGETLSLSGAGVVEWTEGGRHLILAGWGTLSELPASDRIAGLFDAGAPSCEDPIATACFDTHQPVLSAAVRRRPEGGHLGLLLWGEFEGRRESALLLRVLVTAIDRRRHADGAADAPVRGSESSGLVFPDGYYPGTSPQMTALYRQMRMLLRGDLSVLIEGETGVGKELIARILHTSSDRGSGPFVAINCSAIPAELLEAEMFGIAKGVATGVGERPGRFKLAEGGTLFLDEIGDMPVPLQVKLLRALQEKEIHPVGAAPEPIDVRVLAATNADVGARTQAGQFRSDLYYRLAGHTLDVPPLRERPNDIPGLIEHFLRRFGEESGTVVRGLTVKALRTLTVCPWPGNVRQLEHEMRRLVYAASPGQILDSGLLSSAIFDAPAAEEPSSLALAPRMRRFESELIRDALRRTGGHQGRAAELLGLSRNGLVKKLARLGIRPEGRDQG